MKTYSVQEDGHDLSFTIQPSKYLINNTLGVTITVDYDGFIYHQPITYNAIFFIDRGLNSTQLQTMFGPMAQYVNLECAEWAAPLLDVVADPLNLSVICDDHVYYAYKFHDSIIQGE